MFIFDDRQSKFIHIVNVLDIRIQGQTNKCTGFFYSSMEATFGSTMRIDEGRYTVRLQLYFCGQTYCWNDCIFYFGKKKVHGKCTPCRLRCEKQQNHRWLPGLEYIKFLLNKKWNNCSHSYLTVSAIHSFIRSFVHSFVHSLICC